MILLQRKILRSYFNITIYILALKVKSIYLLMRFKILGIGKNLLTHTHKILLMIMNFLLPDPTQTYCRANLQRYYRAVMLSLKFYPLA